MKPSDPPVVVEQVIQASSSDVWQAITQLDQMQKWFFAEIEEFEAAVGFETQFDVVCDGTTYPHRWKITEVSPNEKIVYDWQYENFPGQGLVVWELIDTPEGTHLTITNKILKEFPDDNPAFRRESCEGGWRYFIERLQNYVEQKPASA